MKDETSGVVKDETSDVVKDDNTINASVQKTEDVEDLERKIKQQEFPSETMSIDDIRTAIKDEVIEEIELKERLAHFGVVKNVYRDTLGTDKLHISLENNINNGEISKWTLENIVVNLASYYYNETVTWEDIFDKETKQTNSKRFLLPQIIIMNHSGNIVFYQDLSKP